MRNFKTGAVRGSNKGRGRYDLIYPGVLERLAKRLEFGLMPKPSGDPGYPERNWETGIPDSSWVDSLLHHIKDYLEGERTEDHLGAILFNTQGLIYNEDQIRAGRLDKSLHDLPARSYDSTAGLHDSHSHPGERETAGGSPTGRLAVGPYGPSGGSYLAAYEPTR